MTETLAKTFKVFGDTNRLEIVLYIGKKARSVSEIVKCTGLSQSLVSFHLRTLREANIVTTERKGPFIHYSLSDSKINETLLKLADSIDPNGRKARETPESVLQKVGNKRRSFT